MQDPAPHLDRDPLLRALVGRRAPRVHRRRVLLPVRLEAVEEECIPLDGLGGHAGAAALAPGVDAPAGLIEAGRRGDYS